MVTTSIEHDFTSTVTLHDLAENTTYYYRIIVNDKSPDSMLNLKPFREMQIRQRWAF